MTGFGLAVALPYRAHLQLLRAAQSPQARGAGRVWPRSVHPAGDRLRAGRHQQRHPAGRAGNQTGARLMAFGKLSDEGTINPSPDQHDPDDRRHAGAAHRVHDHRPLLTNAVKLELPEASSQLNQPDKQDINLAIDGAGKIYWNDQEVDEAALLAKMESAGQAEGSCPDPASHRSQGGVRHHRQGDGPGLPARPAQDCLREPAGAVTLPSPTHRHHRAWTPCCHPGSCQHRHLVGIMPMQRQYWPPSPQGRHHETCRLWAPAPAGRHLGRQLPVHAHRRPGVWRRQHHLPAGTVRPHRACRHAPAAARPMGFQGKLKSAMLLGVINSAIRF